MTFDRLGLSEPIARAVAAQGYTTPTPIQSQAIPPALSGGDVLGCAQTGTGKTAAFALPILHRLSRTQRRSARPRALILCPTRELAAQILESFEVYGAGLRLRATAVFGGVNQNPQVRCLRQGVDILVATPGRLLDLVGQRFVDLSEVEVLVLDEADRMLDMGFVPDVRRIIGRLPEQRQTLFFSATMPPEIARLSASILHDPTVVHAATVSSTTAALAQSVYFVSRENKPSLLDRVLRDAGVERTLVFTRTRYGADKLARRLQRTGVRAEAIHGDKTQRARTKALTAFKSGRTPVLVATDVAARGIDVDEVRRVVNYEIPNIAETYVHRVGRTARAGASGIAVSFCDREEIGDLRAIERLIDQPLRVADDAADLVFTAPAPGRTSHPAGPGRTSKKNGSTRTRRRSRSRTRRGGKRSEVSSVTSR